MADQAQTEPSDHLSILPTVTFENKKQKLAQIKDTEDCGKVSLKLTPYIVDFKKLADKDIEIEPQVHIKSNSLLHSVVGLYSVALSEMTPEVLYSTVCEKAAKTIILVQSIEDAILNVNSRLQNRKEAENIKKTDISCTTTANEEDQEDINEESEDEIKGCDSGRDVLEEESIEKSIFCDVYSDTESDSSSEEDDESDEVDYSEGVHSFLKSSHLRHRYKRQPIKAEDIGPEHRVVAAITYKRTYCAAERVIHITVITVRKRARGYGIGKYLVQMVKDSSLVGSYDAVVVHADNSAISFFQRYGFSDDMVINSKWGDIAEQFTNCSLMSYLPPFTGQHPLGSVMPELDIVAMEKELKKWRDKAVEAYVAETSCYNRMRHEIIHLRALVASQEDQILSLRLENEELRLERRLHGKSKTTDQQTLAPKSALH